MIKSSLRTNMKNTRNMLSEAEQKKQSMAIQARLFESSYYINSTNIFTYVSFQSEVDTIAIIENSLKKNKSIFIPKVTGDVIKFYETNNLAPLKQSKFGILEPDLTTNSDLVEHIPIEGERKLMLLPGLVFDLQGNRIGYGAGYYDRYLALYEKETFLKIALAYDFQVLEQLCSEEHDIRVDIIITPEQIIDCRR